MSTIPAQMALFRQQMAAIEPEIVDAVKFRCPKCGAELLLFRGAHSWLFHANHPVSDPLTGCVLRFTRIAQAATIEAMREQVREWLEKEKERAR
jgi:hypothetical protein